MLQTSDDHRHVWVLIHALGFTLCEICGRRWTG